MSDARVLCEVCEKGKFIVNKCLKNKNDINTEKLEKLLIIMHGEMLKKYRKPFFLQPIIVKDENILIPKLREAFIMYNEKFDERFCEYYHLTIAEQEIMDEVIEQYSNMNIDELNNKIELKILSNFFNESDSEFNIVTDEIIGKIFMSLKNFEQNYPKQTHNIKQKVMAIK